MPAQLDSLDVVQDLVGELYRSTVDDLDFTHRMRFEGAVVEIVGNVIEHGAPAVPNERVRLHVALHRDDRDLRAVLTDNGVAVPFDDDVETTMPDADNENGRGLALARALSTELRYERHGRVNRWTIECSCPR